MSDEFLHIQKNELKKDNTVLFLIIPAIIFALTLALFFNKLHKYSSTAFFTQGSSAVLGETSENP